MKKERRKSGDRLQNVFFFRKKSHFTWGKRWGVSPGSGCQDPRTRLLPNREFVCWCHVIAGKGVKKWNYGFWNWQAGGRQVCTFFSSFFFCSFAILFFFCCPFLSLLTFNKSKKWKKKPLWNSTISLNEKERKLNGKWITFWEKNIFSFLIHLLWKEREEEEKVITWVKDKRSMLCSWGVKKELKETENFKWNSK